MSNQFLKLRRSAVQGKIPETSSLDLGELAINTYDGQLFLKKSGSQGEIVTVVGSTGSFTGSFFGNGAGLVDIPASGITGLNLSRIATGSISASVNTDISSSFRVTSGSNTLLNVTRDGRTWIGAGTFADAAYQLDVIGTARINGTLNVTNSLILENNTILFDVVTGPPTAPLRIVRRTGWGVNAGIEIGALNTNISTFTAVPIIVGGGNTYTDNRQTIIGQNNAMSGIGVVLGNDNTVTNSGNINVIIGTGNVQNVSNFNNFAHILVGQGNSTNGFQGGGLFGSAIKYYAAGQLAFGANSSFTNNSISEIFFGNGVRNENNTSVSNNGNGPNISFNPSWATDAADKNGGNITINGGRGTGTGSSGDVIFSTATPTTTGTILQTLSNRWWVKGQSGTLTNKGTSSLAILDVSGSSIFTGSVSVTGSLTASNALITSTLTAQTLVVQTITSSIVYSSGSNIFGNQLSNTQQFTGSILVTGSSVSLTGGSFSGSGANLYGIPAAGITGLNLSQIATGSVTASVNATDISASFRVTSGSNTLLNVTKDGRTWIGAGTFVDAGYQADIQGTTRVNGVLTNTDSYLQIPNSNGLQIGFFSNSTPGTKSNISITNSGTGGSGTAQAFPVMTGLRNIYIVGTDGPSGIGSPTISGNDNLILLRPANNNPLSGNSNTLINSRGQISVGSGNTGLGSAALNGITSGSNNLHLTIGAGLGNGAFTSTLSNSVYIGDPVKSNNNTTVAGDIVITSPYTATTQFWFGGKSDAADVYFNTPAQTGTNQTGAIQYWRASLGTGTGQAGKTIFQHSIPTTSGTTIHSSFTNTLTLETNRVSISGSLSISGTEFNNTSSVTSAGITTVSQLSTSSYTSCFYNYTVASASNARSGQVMTVWNGSTIKYTEVVTTDIGDTNQVIVSSSLSGGFVRLQVSASSGWTFKNISNLL